MFTKLIQALAPPDRLLCLAMDDLQWVDAASLALLSHVLTDAQTRNVLFVGAYRDNEVDATHPLETAVHELQNANVDVAMVSLGALNESDVLQLLRDAFSATGAEVRELALILHTKSGGNPLYLSQFLPYLTDEGLVSFDYSAGKWIWDLARIQQAGVTQDVLELLTFRIEALPESIRTILATAACIGSSFDVGKVAVAAQKSPVEVRQCMTIATREGLIVPDDDHQHQSLSNRPSEFQSTTEFRFLHDRVQEAAFDRITEKAKKEFRLQIGRRLLSGLVLDSEQAPPPYVLANLNSAWSLIEEEEERQRVAHLNLAAGRKARQALAYSDALNFLSVGLDLLGPRSWASNYDLAFRLHCEAFECEYLLANFERADQLFRILIANATSKLEKARVYHTKILLDTSEERHDQVIAVGTEALRLFGISYWRKVTKLHVLIELILVRLRMRGRKPQDLLDAKGLNDPEKIIVLQILLALTPTAYVVSPELFVLTALKAVNYSLRHGIGAISAFGFVLYGLALRNLDKYKGAYEFGRLAVEIAERSNDPSILCKVLYFFALILSVRDYRDGNAPVLDRVHKLALETGDHLYASLAISSQIVPVAVGRNTEDVLRLYDEHWTFVEHSKYQTIIEMVTMSKNCALALQGKTALPYSMSHDAYDEIESEQRYLRTGNLSLAFFQYLFRLQLACLFGRTEEGQTLSDKGEALTRSGAIFSQLADFYLYRGLVAAIALNGADGKAKRRHRKTLRQSVARLHLLRREQSPAASANTRSCSRRKRHGKQAVGRGLEALQQRDRAGGSGRLPTRDRAGQRARSAPLSRRRAAPAGKLVPRLRARGL